MYNIDTQKYLLVYGKKSQKWGFPKGHMEKGETEEETALREFYEETGIRVVHPLQKKIRYRNNVYFMLAVHNHDIPQNIVIQDKIEIDKAEWFSEQNLVKLDMEQCNFGLKKWIQQIMSQKPLTSYTQYHHLTTLVPNVGFV